MGATPPKMSRVRPVERPPTHVKTITRLFTAWEPLEASQWQHGVSRAGARLQPTSHSWRHSESSLHRLSQCLETRETATRSRAPKFARTVSMASRPSTPAGSCPTVMLRVRTMAQHLRLGVLANLLTKQGKLGYCSVLHEKARPGRQEMHPCFVQQGNFFPEAA